MTEQSASEMETVIRNKGIEHVNIEFSDINGISRSKQLTADYFLDNWEDGFPMNLLLLFQTPQSDVPENTGYGKEIDFGDGTVKPDPSTFSLIPWRDNAARVICDFEHNAEPVTAAPRTALKRVLADCSFDFDFFVGSELEFYLLDETQEGYQPATSSKHECMTLATEEVSTFYDTLVEWARNYNVSLNSLQHEHGAGQLEILFKYGSSLEQADTTFDFKQLVKQAARVCGQEATFMAKPYSNRAGSGYHLHVSAFDDTTNVFTDGKEKLSDLGRYFIGGLLEHAGALAALQTPTLNSFKRYKPGGFAPYTASWGWDNRMTALRIPHGTPRIENRIGSADANPYLVIASTLAAGIDGMRRQLEPSDPVVGDPTGCRPELPRSPELALDALKSDTALKEILGADLIRGYTATKKEELRQFRNHVSHWERDQYVETL
ncbi:glutamine synthetase family protein [Haladaptatus sp. DFWS20]|uniref:glutamine synthetase family protein n=1 Tax=Haladaptatus sp. DFWS20 TaxID=3403467 RepID=UPI003EBC187A